VNTIPSPRDCEPRATPEERLQRLAERAEARCIPLRGLLELTFRCPLRCVHCYCCEDGRPLPIYAGRPELDLDAWKRVLDDTAEAGCLELTLTGGEILVRPDWHAIAAHAVRNRFAVTLFTGGTAIEESVADRIAGLGVVTVEATMHAADPATFDSITRVPGSYGRFVRGVERLRARGVPLLLKCILLRPNAEAYRPVADFARAVGARLRFGVELSPRNDGDRRPLAWRMTDAQLEAYFRSDVPAAWEGIPPEPPEVMRDRQICAAGTTTFAINPYGDVFACNQLLVPVGTIREQGFRSLWFDHPSPVLRRVRALRTFADLPGCADCAWSYACRRCHGVAHLETGDMLAPSPSACAQARFVASLRA
jgi:radical SAM protein with 4Fe4S-binding SPASM domain